MENQQALLWARLPPGTVNRFVPDQISSVLPRLPAVQVLQAACQHPPSWQAQWRRAWLRAELAQCLGDPNSLAQGAAAQTAVASYEALIGQQVQAAQAWLAEYDAQSASHRQRLQAELAALQTSSGGHFLGASTSVRENLDSDPDLAATALRLQTQATQSRVQTLSSLPTGQRLQALALLSTGLQLVTDYGVAPPALHLTTDRNTLADALEWQRRDQGYQQRGFHLAGLQTLPQAVLAGSVLLLLVALTCSGHALAIGLWAVATQLLGVGALMLTDVALTGAPSLRYLVVRQFQSFGVGDWWLPLTFDLPMPTGWGHGVLTVWWPLLGVAAGVLLLRLLRDGRSLLMAPVRAWVRWGESVGWGVLQSALLLGAGALAVLFLGMPAAVSELLILMGCVGVASYLARQAPYANMGAGLQIYNILLVTAALALAVGGSLWRGDLGHALVALLLASCFAWLFGWHWLRGMMLVGAVGGLALLTVCWMTGELPGPLAQWVQHLPPHAQDRIHAMFDPFHAGSSDLARVRWLMQSAGMTGWGLAYAPWQGLSGARWQDGLPLQGPSDYVLALTTTLWGQAGGLALMGCVLAVLTLSAVLGLGTALRAAMPAAVRWLAAVGGLGCMVMAAKVVLSVGGVTGVLPLTGLPVGLLGYGPVTHLAALLYMALALGTLHVRPLETLRGINVQTRPTPTGAVRRRGLGLALVSIAGLGVLLVLGFWHLRSDPAGTPGQRHLARARLTLAQAITQALVPADTIDGGKAGRAAVLPCPELGNAVAAWNLQLGTLAHPVRVIAGDRPASGEVTQSLQLDAARLLAVQPAANLRACQTLARTLGQMLGTDLARLVGHQGKSPIKEGSRLGVFDRPRSVGARPLDYATANAWWGQPGCLLSAPDLAQLKGDPAHAAKACALPAAPPTDLSTDSLMNQTVTDAWLQRNLAPQLFAAMRIPVAEQMLNHHTVAVGPVLGLTLVPTLQQTAQRMVDCATGRLHGADCEAVLPLDPVWQQRHYTDDGALRAGAMGVVMAEVNSGRVVALAGAVSDCTLKHLGQPARADAKGKMPALTEGSRCAQLPDQRSDWLAQQHPALWMVPPGSSVKPFSLVAGMDAGVIGAGDNDYWKKILAESHERLPIQRTALAAGKRYLDVLSGVGFGQANPELLWGGLKGDDGKPLFHSRWETEAYSGTQNLRATTMPLAQVEQIRHQKDQGINVDKLYGETVTTEFVAARRLADASVGGGDIRINAVGLVDAWRALDLRARGQTHATALHLLERAGQALPAKSLTWASQSAARRVLVMTSGVTASAWKGTAQGSCRVVMGVCPTQGLDGLSGKTGTSDFLTAEDGPLAKPGMQLPAKLFGGVFAAPDGKRYAIAVMALRVREGHLSTLDLTSSAPAEAALTLMRSMGVK